MNRYHKNQMHLNLSGIVSPMFFDCYAATRVAYLTQAVFVNFNKFKPMTS